MPAWCDKPSEGGTGQSGWGSSSVPLIRPDGAPNTSHVPLVGVGEPVSPEAAGEEFIAASPQPEIPETLPACFAGNKKSSERAPGWDTGLD